LLLFLLLLVFGVVLVVSILGNMTGLGGGVPLVIFFLYYARFNPVESGGLSLLAILLSTVSGSFSNLMKKVVNIKLLLLIAVPGCLGAVMGSIAVDLVPDVQFKGAFSLVTIMLGVVSLTTAVRQSRFGTRSGGRPERDDVRDRSLTRLMSFVAGVVAGFIGLGLGGIMGTFLTTHQGLRARTGFSTVLAATIPVAVVGDLVHFSSFPVSASTLEYLVPMVLGSFAGAALGSYILRRSGSVRSRLLQGSVMISFGALNLLLFLYTTNVI
jgi:uncharacterized protein